MTGYEYLRNILTREAVDNSWMSPVRSVQATLQPIIQAWAGRYLSSFSPSGSFAKGTANRSGTDIDFFVSLHSETPETLKEIHEKLFGRMSENGYSPRRQNVSIGIRVGGYDVDLVPAKMQPSLWGDHSLYRRKADTWTKTNVQTHINLVSASAYRDEIRILKLWRNQKSLDFPSFYLELTTMKALDGTLFGSLDTNVMTCFEYLRDRFENARVEDPANTSNVLSDELAGTTKKAIATAASTARAAATWEEIVR